MDKDDALIAVQEAQDQIFTAIETIEQVVDSVDGLHQGYWRAYWLDQMAIAVSSEHSFLSQNPNLDDLKKEIEEAFAPACEACDEPLGKHKPLCDSCHAENETPFVPLDLERYP